MELMEKLLKALEAVDFTAFTEEYIDDILDNLGNGILC